jgi:hypothetical protein
MKIAFKRADIIKGGKHENLFYNQVLVPERKRERLGGKVLVEIDENEVPFNFLATNKDDFEWENVSIFVEVPVSYKTTNVPTWLPNRAFIDEEGVEQIHTLESWGGVVRENLAGTRMLVKLTLHGDVTGAAFNSLATFINGAGTRIGLSVQEARDLIATAAYTLPE